MRVLVTGGAGFIGSHLVDRLLADGADVVVVDDFSTGSRANLAGLDPARLTIVDGPVQDPAILGRATPGVERVFHLAAAVGVFEILRRPLECLRTNLDAAEAVFEWAAGAGVRTVFTSTSEVYGKNAKPLLQRGRRLDLRPDDRPPLAVRGLEGDRRISRPRDASRDRLPGDDRAAVQHDGPAPVRRVRDGRAAPRRAGARRRIR